MVLVPHPSPFSHALIIEILQVDRYHPTPRHMLYIDQLFIGRQIYIILWGSNHSPLRCHLIGFLCWIYPIEKDREGWRDASIIGSSNVAFWLDKWNSTLPTKWDPIINCCFGQKRFHQEKEDTKGFILPSTLSNNDKKRIRR